MKNKIIFGICLLFIAIGFSQNVVFGQCPPGNATVSGTITIDPRYQTPDSNIWMTVCNPNGKCVASTTIINESYNLEFSTSSIFGKYSINYYASNGQGPSENWTFKYDVNITTPDAVIIMPVLYIGGLTVQGTIGLDDKYKSAVSKVWLCILDPDGIAPTLGNGYIENTNKYSFTIPSNLVPGRYSIYVFADGDRELYFWSNRYYFDIYDNYTTVTIPYISVPIAAYTFHNLKVTASNTTSSYPTMIISGEFQNNRDNTAGESININWYINSWNFPDNVYPIYVFGTPKIGTKKIVTGEKYSRTKFSITCKFKEPIPENYWQWPSTQIQATETDAPLFGLKTNLINAPHPPLTK